MSHWQSKTTIRPVDTLFSDFIRRRDGRCQYKVKCYGEARDWHELDNSHYHGRGKESTRFEPLNCDAACKACHNFVHTAEGQRWLDAWKEKQLGTQQFNRLLLQANTPQKKDDVMMKLYVRELLKGLE